MKDLLGGLIGLVLLLIIIGGSIALIIFAVSNLGLLFAILLGLIALLIVYSLIAYFFTSIFYEEMPNGELQKRNLLETLVMISFTISFLLAGVGFIFGKLMTNNPTFLYIGMIGIFFMIISLFLNYIEENKIKSFNDFTQHCLYKIKTSSDVRLLLIIGIILLTFAMLGLFFYLYRTILR